MAHPISSARSLSSIEPLESRIAPALLVNGANLLGGSSPSTGETSVGDHSALLVKVLSGQALVWFDGTSITSISVGPNTSLEVHGDILGDIIGNLTASGRLSDSDNDPSNGEDGGVLLPNTLISLKTIPLSNQAGSLGSIITGGAIQKLTISGTISGVYAGDGVFRTESSIGGSGLVVSSTGSIDINPVEPGIQNLFQLDQADAHFLAGAGISNVKITNASALEMYAGNGGPANGSVSGQGPGGGSIVNVTIENAFVPAGAPQDTPSYHLIAGDGEAGKRGGAGGSISQVIEKASFGPVTLHAGNGGAGIGGAGGLGGDVATLDMQSASARYTVTAGNGGPGTPGGAGGKLLNNNFANRTPVSGVIISGDFNGDGVDDVLVADAGSGQMVISTQGDFDPSTGFNDGNGTDFKPIIQFSKNGQDTVLIDAAGSTPIAGGAYDVDNDGDLDVVIAYKNSSSLGIFLNQGKGVFYDSALEEFTSTQVALGFTPQKLTSLNTSGSLLAISENSGGKGLLHLVTGSVSNDGDPSYSVDSRANVFATPIADLAPGYVGFTNGKISRFDINDLQSKNPFTIEELAVAITGGIDAIDLDSTGLRLLALSTIERTLTVIDTTGDTVDPLATINLNSIPGKPLIARFIHDSDPLTEDDIAVLTAPTNGSEFAVYNPVAPDADPATIDPGYQLGTTFVSSSLLKNFVPVYGNANVGVAALASSLSQFTFVNDFLTAQEFPLPFASKSVSVFSGRGGDGLDVGIKLGKGGAGGIISGLNADAQIITLHAGNGGDTQNGAAGAGGSISNPIDFVTGSGSHVSPALLAEASLDIATGNGGSPQGVGGKSASGGAGGSLIGISATLTAGDITLTSGLGGNGKGGAGGNGGSIVGTNTTAQDGNLIVIAGGGGAATSGVAAGGAGGSIGTLTHVLALDSEIEKLEHPYSVTLTAGAAGTSVGGQGGAGGNIGNISLTLDGSDRTYDDPTAKPPLVDAHRDSTVRVTATAGAGGQGAIGGVGGLIRNFSSESVYDQELKGGIFLNYVVMTLTAGAGGIGTAGNGGAGGIIMLGHPISGVTSWDPDAKNDANGLAFDPTVPALVVTGGAGGDGTAKGGAGGSIAGLVAQNSAFVDGNPITATHLASAVIEAGKGGNGGTGKGGKGGDVSNALLGVNNGNPYFTIAVPNVGGYLTVTAGAGGDSTGAKGGAGGGILTSEFGLVSTLADVGLLVHGGSGGQGSTGGGAGGVVSGLRVNTPESTIGLSALIYAGSGGAATSGAGVGGRGGDINGVLQAKDVNSSINLLQAGNGGDNAGGLAGAGGSVLNVQTVGFIGRPSDGVNRLGVFDTVGSLTIAQGIFAGRSGVGQSTAANGAVKGIVARQIAAIAAAVDMNTGLFAVATKVANVTADLIGFDKAGDSTFADMNGGTSSPHAVRPDDGFILAAALAAVTGQRQGYVFNS